MAETEGASIEDDILIWRQWCHICHKKQARLAAVTNGLAVRDESAQLGVTTKINLLQIYADCKNLEAKEQKMHLAAQEQVSIDPRMLLQIKPQNFPT